MEDKCCMCGNEIDEDKGFTIMGKLYCHECWREKQDGPFDKINENAFKDEDEIIPADSFVLCKKETARLDKGDIIVLVAKKIGKDVKGVIPEDEVIVKSPSFGVVYVNEQYSLVDAQNIAGFIRKKGQREWRNAIKEK